MYNSNNTAVTVGDSYGGGGSVSDGATANNGDCDNNNQPEFQCDCVCSCCCQCYEIKPPTEIAPMASATVNNNIANDNTHKVSSQDLVVHRRRRRRKRRAKSGNFEQLLSLSENPTKASSLPISGSRRNSAYCICKLEIKFVW
nr:uncharacterized protein LOC115267771 [Aedes albopictus]XP_029730905.1 uncharacterized protein LOC115267771 [Aedes albopictus]